MKRKVSSKFRAGVLKPEVCRFRGGAESGTHYRKTRLATDRLYLLYFYAVSDTFTYFYAVSDVLK